MVLSAAEKTEVGRGGAVGLALQGLGEAVRGWEGLFSVWDRMLREALS